MSNLLNLDAIRFSESHQTPFSWYFIPQVFQSSTIAKELAKSFPAEGYNHYTRHSTAKNYDTYGRFLIKMGHGRIHEPEQQPPIWRQLAEELLSKEYVEAVEDATGLSLLGTHLEAVYWRLTEGCTIDPHTDTALKKVSHLFYFNEDWDPADGGCLRILRSWRMDDFAFELPPKINTSLLLVRSRNSWHGYEPIKGKRVRKAVQISFCTCAAV